MAGRLLGIGPEQVARHHVVVPDQEDCGAGLAEPGALEDDIAFGGIVIRCSSTPTCTSNETIVRGVDAGAAIRQQATAQASTPM